MTRLLLVRHGQSTWNADGRWQGQADAPLSDFGRLQAAHAAAAVGAVDAVYASTLDRARITAEIIAESIGVGPVIVLDDLQERDAGEWSGRTRAEIEVDYPGYLAEGRRPPGWEGDDELIARVLPSLEAIGLRHPDGDVLVVTHGGVIYRVEDHLGEPAGRIANLGGRWIELVGDHQFRLGPRLDLLEGAEITVPDQI